LPTSKATTTDQQHACEQTEKHIVGKVLGNFLTNNYFEIIVLIGRMLRTFNRSVLLFNVFITLK
jgi:hypothetical protein